MAPRRRIWALFGSIRTRLAIFFFLITLIAVAVVYVYVTPSLQSHLELQELKDTKGLASRVNSRTHSKHLAHLANSELGEQDDVAFSSTVMPGLVPGIHDFFPRRRGWPGQARP